MHFEFFNNRFWEIILVFIVFLLASARIRITK